MRPSNGAGQPGPSDATPAGRTTRTTRATGRHRAELALAGACLVAVGLTVAVVLDAHWIHVLDTSVVSWISSWAGESAVTAARILGELTENPWSTLVALAVAAALVRAGFTAAARFVVGSALLGVLLVGLTKVLVGRQRPDSASVYDVHMHLSFPSGHAAAGIYLYLAIGVVALRLGRAHDWRGARAVGWFLVVLGPVIGLSRLVLAVHWPSDVLAGWAFGAAAALTVALVLWDGLTGELTYALETPAEVLGRAPGTAVAPPEGPERNSVAGPDPGTDPRTDPGSDPAAGEVRSPRPGSTAQ